MDDHSAGFVARVCMVVVLLGALVPASRAHAQTLTTLFDFYCGASCDDGIDPIGSLLQATDGDLYGTTYSGGGIYSAGVNDGGSVFEITPGGQFTALFDFCIQYGCGDANRPNGALIQATNGQLYGTTGEGGAYGGGTIFTMTQRGALRTLYDFCELSTSPCLPTAGLTQASNGNLYGTSGRGGAYGGGTVFEMTPDGTLTTLYSFCAQSGCPDGKIPYAGLVQATDGNLYGTTSIGGAYNGGTVFKITLDGTLTTLHAFCAQSGCPDGSYPIAALIQEPGGDLYGTTYQGGANPRTGTVFKITRSGTFSTLHSFCVQSECPDGAAPAGLVRTADGALYGTTMVGGAHGRGTIFKITTSGTLTTLYSFCAQSGCPDGFSPSNTLMQATNGDLYGTTADGGAHRGGTVFQFSVGLGPFVETLPASGAVGTTVIILGTDLTGVSSVTFNGTAAAFSADSATAISATVPAGASTGTIVVTTPSGTLSSNVPFRVMQ